MSYINFVVNYKNVMSALYNNKLYLTNAFSVVLSDGLYDIDAINNVVLVGLLNAKYYKVMFNPLKAQYSIY